MHTTHPQHCSDELQTSNLDVAWSYIQSSSPLLTKLLLPVLRPGAPSSCFLFILGHVACTTNLLEGRKQSDYDEGVSRHGAQICKPHIINATRQRAVSHSLPLQLPPQKTLIATDTTMTTVTNHLPEPP